MSEIADIFESMRTGNQLTGKAYRAQNEYGGSEEVVGRAKGYKAAYPEFRNFRETPKQIEQAIKRGKGKSFQRIYDAVAGYVDRYIYKAPEPSTVEGHESMTKKCRRCGTTHTKGQHRSHGKGSFRFTHPGDSMDFNFNAGGRRLTRWEAAEGYVFDCSDCGVETSRAFVGKDGAVRCLSCARKAKGLSNPRGGTKIYGKVLEIMCQRTNDHKCDRECKAVNHRYKHVFEKPAAIFGNDDGTLTIRPGR